MEVGFSKLIKVVPFGCLVRLRSVTLGNRPVRTRMPGGVGFLLPTSITIKHAGRAIHIFSISFKDKVFHLSIIKFSCFISFMAFLTAVA